MGCLLDALERAWRVLGLDAAAGRDEVFFQLVAARIIRRPASWTACGSWRKRGRATSYPTVNRRLRVYAKDSWRQQISAACAAHARLGPASLVLFDVSTLYFETDEGDGFRESGFSKERRLEPQITIGLLTGQDGFPLMVSAFEGNRAETTTMLPVIESFMAAHDLPDVTVVADAGMCRRKTRSRSRPRACRSSSAPAFPMSLTWSRSGAATTPARTFLTARIHSAVSGRAERGRRDQSSTISTALTEPAARCAASMSSDQSRAYDGWKTP